MERERKRWCVAAWPLAVIVAWWALTVVPGLLRAGDLSDQPTEAALPKSEDDEYELQKMFVDTLEHIQQNYVKQVTRRQLIEAAIRGMLDELDPYSSYIDPEHLEQFRSSVEAQFGGIGIQIGIDSQRLRVIAPLFDTPAYHAGLMAGDVILEIDGKSTNGISIEEASEQLKGEPGTSVRLKVLHQHADEPHEVEITRAVIHVPTVVGYRRKNDGSWDYFFDRQMGIGYVRVTAFSRGTTNDLRRTLEELTKEGLAGLILDLRFNPGGLLQSAIQVSDLFLERGVIVSTKGRNVAETTWEAHQEGTFAGFPMVVLVNRYSASASEIVAACLQDHKRAVIIGERTWGKGSVQNLIPLDDNHSALKLTTSSYFRPSGKNIHRFPDAREEDEWGVHPDDGYELRMSPRELAGLIEDRRRRDAVSPPETGEVQPPESAPEAAPPERPAGASPQENRPSEATAAKNDRAESRAVFEDRHLALAVEYLSSRLAKAEQPEPPAAEQAAKSEAAEQPAQKADQSP